MVGSGWLKDALARGVGRGLTRVFRRADLAELTAPKSIAVIKPCCLGDVLMATAVLKPLREAYPEASITFVVGDWAKEAIANNPYVDTVVSCGRLSGNTHSPGDYLSVIKTLRNGRFDWCIVLERSVWMALLPLLAGIPVRAGLDSEGRGFSLNVRVPCNGSRHEVERYLDCIRALGICPSSPRLEFHPTPRDRERALGLLPKPRKTAPLIAIHPGGGSNPGMTLLAKRWSPARFAALANLLTQERGASIVLLGAAYDSPLADEVRNSLKTPAIDLAGKLSLGETAAVLQLCQLFVGNDTGPLHLAVAVGTPVVAIFGPSDPRVYGPYSQDAAVVSAALPCSPCFVRGTATRCRGVSCMDGISVERVWQAVQAQL